MRRVLALTTVVAVLGFVGACAQAVPPAPAPDTDAMVAAADALDQSFLEAFNRGDAAAIAELYWNDPAVVSFPPDSLIARGVPAIQEANGNFFAAMQGAALELTESHQIPVGEAVIGWGLFKITMPVPDGAPMELVGRYTDVKAERDGKWVYLVDHASVPVAE